MHKYLGKQNCVSYKFQQRMEKNENAYAAGWPPFANSTSLPLFRTKKYYTVEPVTFIP